MFKILLFITFIISTNAFSEDLGYGGFEGELHALEAGQLKAEELEIRNVDAVTGVVTDEVATGQAAVEKPKEKKTEEVLTPEVKNTSARRIRSR